MARGASVALLLLWSWLLYRDHRFTLPIRVALLMNASLCCYFITPNAPWSPADGIGLFLLKAGQFAAPCLFWLHSRIWFNDEDRIGWRSWLLCVGSTAMLVAAMIISAYNRELYSTLLTGMIICWSAFAVAGIWTVWRGRQDDLVEGRRGVRVQVISMIGGYLLFILATNVFANLFAGSKAVSAAASLGVPIVTAYLVSIVVSVRFPLSFGWPATDAPSVQPVATDDPATNRLLTFMEHQKPYRNEALTIAGLAAQLGEQEYRLRRIINGQLGYRNFSAFLNEYRLAEVKAALRDQHQKDVPILTIALDSGFGSLASFHRAFRQAEDCTPSAFRATALTNSEIEQSDLK
jgi:AraC-like DNA-binding protein